MCGTYVDDSGELVESEGCKAIRQRDKRCEEGFTSDELRCQICAIVRDYQIEQRAQQLEKIGPKEQPNGTDTPE